MTNFDIFLMFLDYHNWLLGAISFLKKVVIDFWLVCEEMQQHKTIASWVLTHLTEGLYAYINQTYFLFYKLQIRST